VTFCKLLANLGNLDTTVKVVVWLGSHKLKSWNQTSCNCKVRLLTIYLKCVGPTNHSFPL